MDWSGIAQAYADRERARLGLPTRQQVIDMRAKRAEDAAAAASALETGQVGRELTRAKIAEMPGEAALRDANIQALIDYRHAQTGKAEADKFGNWQPLTDDKGAYTGYMQRTNLQTGQPEVTEVPQLRGMRSKAAPKPAAPPSAIGPTVTIQDPNDISKTIVIDKRTNKPVTYAGGIAAGPAAAMQRNKGAAADTILQRIAKIKQTLQDPEVQAVVGPRAGTMQELRDTAVGRLTTGGMSPKARGLLADIGSLEALLSPLHQYRGGAQTHAQFSEMLGGGIHQRPENILAAVNSIESMANDIKSGALVPEGDAPAAHADAVATHASAPAPTAPAAASAGGEMVFNPATGKLE